MTTPPTAETGTGPDTLVLHVSGSQYGGIMPTYTVSVDGTPIGGVFTALSTHGQGSDSVVLHGTWGANAQVSVDYTNDDFSRAADWSSPVAAMAVPGNDRNLYVDGIEYNGAAVAGGARAIYDDRYDVTPVATHLGTDLASARQQEAATLTTNQASAGDVAALDAQLADYYAANGITPEDIAQHNAVQANPDAAIQAGQSGNFTFNGISLHLEKWEDFTSGNAGAFTNLWGQSGVNETEGLVSRAGGPGAFSGAMMPAAGASSGLGEGFYILSGTLQTEEAAKNGPYFCLWPSTDRWPGPEQDLVEILPNGQAYGTQHWKGADGSNQYHSTVYEGVDPKAPHFYWIDWVSASDSSPGRLTYGVDDKAWYTTTENVPRDYAHGGENLSPGLGNKFEGFSNAGSLTGFVYATHTDHSPVG
jgi:hypothetical protein